MWARDLYHLRQVAARARSFFFELQILFRIPVRHVWCCITLRLASKPLSDACSDAELHIGIPSCACYIERGFPEEQAGVCRCSIKLRIVLPWSESSALAMWGFRCSMPSTRPGSRS